MTDSFFTRWRRAVRLPMMFAVGFSAFAILSAQQPDSDLSKYHVSTMTAVAFYFLAAAAVGVLVVMAGPWARTAWHGAFLGFLFGTVMYLVLFFVLAYDPAIVLPMIGICALLGLGLGAPVGAAVWWRSRRKSRL